jgi:hypothetical protein
MIDEAPSMFGIRSTALVDGRTQCLRPAGLFERWRRFAVNSVSLPGR